ncbi:uncharacterized protein [Rutidosis leptorrhynchoides]|uniref:uncharacterized protein n=1 Tax=Rutidosis leptorrhynchoides TaxID=125765 RepID=UPI003A9A42C6
MDLEQSSHQMPIYFVSKVLLGGELNYRPIEKLVYALVVTARCLHRYFQAHPITVLTDQPIRQLLYKPKISGRLTKWALELGEHEISYCARSAIKGQVMADYLVETAADMPVIDDPEQLPAPPLELWELYTDVATSSEEYEALLAGMRIARELGIKKLQAYVDSQLVANQINGTFDAMTSPCNCTWL